MNYTIHQLQIFLKVAETKSITRASEQLYMTQPAVSIQLKNFQDQFSIPLTEVVGRKLYVTDFGYEIAKIAERIIQELEQIQFKTHAFNGLLSGKLSISSASTGKYVIPYFLSGFIDQHVGVDLILDVTNKAKVINSLKKNEIEFALVSTLPDSLEVNEVRLLDNKLFFFSNQPDRKSQKKQLIYREEGSATRAAMENYFGSDSKKSKRKKIELTSNEAVKQAVLAGLGNSIMPVIGLHNELENGQLHIIPKKNLPIVTVWRLIWLKEKKLSPIAQAFLEYLRKEKDEINRRYFHWYENY